MAAPPPDLPWLNPLDPLTDDPASPSVVPSTRLLRLTQDLEDLRAQCDVLHQAAERLAMERLALVRILSVLFPSHRVSMEGDLPAVCVHFPEAACVWPILDLPTAFGALPAGPFCAQALVSPPLRLQALLQALPLSV